MTTVLTPTDPGDQPSASPLRDKAGSSFTALTRTIHEMVLMRRRYGYYWAKLIGAVLILAAWVVVAAGQRRGARGCHDPGRVPGS